MNCGIWNCEVLPRDDHTKDNLGKWPHLSMRFGHLACFLISLMLLSPLSSASELVGGQDENPSPEDVPFTIVARDTPSIDGETWAMTIEMNEEEHANGTVFEITTQICTNDGVCDPPVLMDMTVDERTHAIDLKPKDDHTYINWRVKATYEDGNSTNFPQGSWYTTWSSCWQNDGAYGGVDANAEKDGCGSDQPIPGFGALVAISGLVMAAAFTRRD